MTQVEPTVAEREQPPPYVEGSKPPGAIGEPSTSRDPSCGMGVNSVFQPSTQQHVNYVSLYSKHNAISGASSCTLHPSTRAILLRIDQARTSSTPSSQDPR